MNPSTPPKGSLEDLFRHHLLESEAAAIPPPPQVWEHLDNRLLLAQNENYRRRLAAYRWAVAASLLLASLAGGGWWHSQQNATPTATLAQATFPATTRPGLATAQRAVAPAPLAHTAGNTTVAVTSSSLPSSPAIDQTATLLASRSVSHVATAAYAQPAGRARATRAVAPSTTGALAAGTATGGLATSALIAAQLPTGERAPSQVTANSTSTTRVASDEVPTTPLPVVNSLNELAINKVAHSEPLTNTTSDSYVVATAIPAGEASLATRWSNLLTGPPANLPASLAAVTVAPGPPLELARSWQYGASYTASAFRPNIDFSKAADAYNTAFGLNSPIITRSAAAEYRNNLHTGLGQRLSLWATRRLGASRWSLRTGLELAQSTATSASSVAFVGEQVADLAYYTQASAYVPPARLQRTSYRYRSVNVPVEARYANPTKTGFSFYGRVGAFVTALLNVHSEVDGNPEAARTYTPTSVSSPYRHLSVGLRGGGGLQYRPAGHQWALNLGPVAELGVLSLNANPSQDFLNQQRPYSFGLEAGVELGRGFKIQ